MAACTATPGRWRISSGRAAAAYGPLALSPRRPAPPLLDGYFNNRVARIPGARPLWGTVLAL
eukprot:5804260-Lingulodinium_polyedra.AAC.1